MVPFKLCSPNSVFNNIYAGDTWSGMTVKGEFTGDPEDRLPSIAHARMQFRDVYKKLVYELNTETGSEYGLPTNYPNNTTGNISIIDAEDWILSVDAQPLPMQAGSYIWDLEIVDALNVRRSVLSGTMTICADITK